MTGSFRLSIIVVSYNTRNLLRKCLSSIYQHSEGIGVEIIVIDNASVDGSAEMVKREFPQTILFKNLTNVGFARAVNQGLRVARGSHILLLNSDVEILPQALQRSLAFLQSHPDAGIVGCKLLNPDGTLQPSCECFPYLRDILFESLFLDRLFPRSQFFGRFHLTFFRYDRVAKVDRVMGAFLLIRGETYKAIGMLDEGFFFYGEETDWCYRAKQKGWEVYFFPDAQAIHYGGQSADRISSRMFVQLHESRYRFYRKYHNDLSSIAARVLLGMGALLRTFAWSAVALRELVFGPQRASYVKKKIRASWAACCWYCGIGQSQDRAGARLDS